MSGYGRGGERVEVEGMVRLVPHSQKGGRCHGRRRERRRGRRGGGGDARGVHSPRIARRPDSGGCVPCGVREAASGFIIVLAVAAAVRRPALAPREQGVGPAHGHIPHERLRSRRKLQGQGRGGRRRHRRRRRRIRSGQVQGRPHLPVRMEDVDVAPRVQSAQPQLRQAQVRTVPSRGGEWTRCGELLRSRHVRSLSRPRLSGEGRGRRERHRRRGGAGEEASSDGGCGVPAGGRRG
mmetsp:Transcript_39819/g.119754  ORF Transcript_39819/g.119754 Transcript_39819/m.119754 type:complete len:237 (+) Transcript_39819:2237-2947(+)